MKLSMLFLAFALFPLIADANQRPTNESVVKQTYAFSDIEIFGSLAIITFSVFMITAIYFLKRNAGFSEEGVIKLASLILIVSGTLFLVTLGFSAEQIAPALGILGTIAGYMLGQSSKPDETRKSSNKGNET